MYAYIKGTLMYASPLYAVVDNGGIGYKILIPTNLLGKLPQIGNEVTLHTSFVVRELSQTLFGFMSEHERDLFEALNNVNGIGPKVALSVIGHLSSHDLHQAISTNDIRAISRVPGIGKKTAERLIIEMRDKLPAGIVPSDLAIQIQSDPMTQKITDAMGALINLGYNQVSAQQAIKKSLEDLPEEIDLPSLITHALNHM